MCCCNSADIDLTIPLICTQAVQIWDMNGKGKVDHFSLEKKAPRR